MQICLFLNWVGGLHAICEHVKYDDISELCQTAQFAHYRQTTFGQFQNLCHVSYVVCAMLLKELSPQNHSNERKDQLFSYANYFRKFKADIKDLKERKEKVMSRIPRIAFFRTKPFLVLSMKMQNNNNNNKNPDPRVTLTFNFVFQLVTVRPGFRPAGSTCFLLPPSTVTFSQTEDKLSARNVSDRAVGSFRSGTNMYRPLPFSLWHFLSESFSY